MSDELKVVLHMNLKDILKEAKWIPFWAYRSM
jgi:hypothetical protein